MKSIKYTTKLLKIKQSNIVDWNKIWTKRLGKSKQFLINVLESVAYYSKFTPLYNKLIKDIKY